MSDKIIVKGRMIECDSCMSLNPEDKTTCKIELSPRELLEQLTHKQIGELLDMINLPQPQQEYCSCPKERGYHYQDGRVCNYCGKPIRPEAKPEPPIDCNCKPYNEGYCNKCGGYLPTHPKHQPQQKFCTCPDSDIINEIHHCNACGRPLCPEAKPELASEEEIKNIIDETLYPNGKYRKQLTGITVLQGVILRDDIAHALVGKIGKPKAKKEIEELEFDKLDIARVDPEKRKFVIDLQLALNTIRTKLNEIIHHINRKD